MSSDTIPKSVLRSLDQVETALDALSNSIKEALDADVPTDDASRARREIDLALAASSLFLLIKRVKGEDDDAAVKQVEKCVKASDKIHGREKVPSSNDKAASQKKRPESSSSSRANSGGSKKSKKI